MTESALSHTAHDNPFLGYLGQPQQFFAKPLAIDLVQVLLQQVALTPEMTGAPGNHQAIIAAIAGAIAKDDKLLLGDDGWVDIVRILLDEAAANPGRLFRLDTADPAQMLGAKVISTFLSSVSGAALEDLGGGNVLFGDTLKRAIVVSIGIVASNPAEAAVALGVHDPAGRNLLRDLLDEVNKAVATVKRNDQFAFGAKEWMRLYQGMLLRLLANIENHTQPSLPTLMQGTALSPGGKILVDQILKAKQGKKG